MAKVFLTNTTEHAIHIAGSKKEGSRLSSNIILSPLAAVEVPPAALKIKGVIYLMDKGSLRQLAPEEVEKVEKELAGVLTSDDD